MMVFYRNQSVYKFPQISGTLLIILAELCNAVTWTDTTPPLIICFFSFFFLKALETVPGETRFKRYPCYPHVLHLYCSQVKCTRQYFVFKLSPKDV